MRAAAKEFPTEPELRPELVDPGRVLELESEAVKRSPAFFNSGEAIERCISARSAPGPPS